MAPLWAPLTPGATMDVTDLAVLFHARPELLGAEATYYTPWDMAPDGRFLMVRAVSGAVTARMPAPGKRLGRREGG